MGNAFLFFALASFEKLTKADAVILLEGDGYTRIRKACSLLKDGWSDTLVFSGGIEDLNYGSYPYEMCIDRILAEGISPDAIIHESRSKHTRDQAEQVVNLCVDRKWSHIILVATHYHQYRAFLTFLKVVEEKQLFSSLKISNAPAMADWFERTPWGVRAELLNAEVRKIEEYRSKGHISDFESAVEYFQLWNNT